MKTFERDLVYNLLKRLKPKPRFLQIVVGSRQVGKTTALHQVIKKWKGEAFYKSADLPVPPDAYWIETQWNAAREGMKKKGGASLLVLDEIQKIPRWSEVVKAHWDEDRRQNRSLRVVLLGSSSIQIQQGTNESLAGRFELHYCSHWSLTECKKAFGWDLNKWLFYGGYPGSVPLTKDFQQWAAYIENSIIGPAITKDVLQLTPVIKPALLRQLFWLSVRYPARILSFNKMLGQLQDAGNTVTLAHYLELLSSAYLLSGLQRWSGSQVRVKSSSPKLIVWNNALINAMSQLSLRESRKEKESWGWLIENAVGAYILNQKSISLNLYYWRERNHEIDYVVEKGKKRLLIEVKSGRRRYPAAFKEFQKKYGPCKTITVGPGWIDWETFFTSSIDDWI